MDEGETGGKRGWERSEGWSRQGVWALGELGMVSNVMGTREGSFSEWKSSGLGPAGYPWEDHAPSLVLSPHLYQDVLDKLMSEGLFLHCLL